MGLQARALEAVQKITEEHKFAAKERMKRVLGISDIDILTYSDKRFIAKIDGMVFVVTQYGEFTLGKFCNVCNGLVAADMSIYNLQDLGTLLRDNGHYKWHEHRNVFSMLIKTTFSLE